MKTLSVIGLATFVAAIGPMAGSASAAPSVYTARDMNADTNSRLAAWPNSQNAANAFTAGLTSVKIDSFETAIPDSMDPTMHFGASLTAAVSGGVVRAVPPGQTNGNGRYPISGLNYLAADQASLRMSFSQPINAFGFWGVDVGDFGGVLTINLLGGGIRQFTISPSSQGGETSGSVMFWGVIDKDNPFTSVRFDNSSGIGDVFAFDDITVGALGIPLPTAGLLGAAGLLGVAAMRRRR